MKKTVRRLAKKNKWVRFCVLLLLPLLLLGGAARAQEDKPAARAEQDKILENVDLSGLEPFYNPEITGTADFRSLVEQLASGQLELKGDTLLSTIFNLLFYQLKSVFPLVLQIAGLTLLAAVATHLQKQESSTAKVMNFIVYGMSAALLAGSLVTLLLNVKASISAMGNVIALSVPLMTGLLLSIGSSASAGVIQPNAALLSGGISALILQVVLPLTGVCLTLTVASWLFGKERLGALKNFFKTLVNWMLGIIFTVFAAVTTLGGLAAASYDGVSLRAVKYAINNGVPIIGSMVGESMNLVLASSYLVKNALGLGTCLLIALYALTPFLNVGAFILLLRGAAAVLAPLEGSQISGLLQDVADTLRLLLTAVFGTAVAAMVLLGAAISAGSALV